MKNVWISGTHIHFVETHGGTELGVQIDTDKSDWSGCDFEKQAGICHLEGLLSLDAVDVRCVVEVELPSFEGIGCLVREGL